MHWNNYTSGVRGHFTETIDSFPIKDPLGKKTDLIS